MHRVVITGQGAINALGRSAGETMAAMREGRSGIGALDFQDVDRLAITIGGQIRGYRPEEEFTRAELVLYDPFTQFALHAAREAMEASGLVIDDALAEQAGVVLGTSGGGLQTQDENYRLVYQEGKNRVHPLVVPRLMNSAAASHVSMRYNLQGPSFTVATACASSNHAMGLAMGLIRSGRPRWC
jgi:nodulation protein E